LSSATDGTDNPVVASAGISACTGFKGNRTVDVIGATMVVLVNRLDVLFWMTNAGLVYLISEPTLGSSAVPVTRRRYHGVSEEVKGYAVGKALCGTVTEPGRQATVFLPSPTLIERPEKHLRKRDVRVRILKDDKPQHLFTPPTP
jgi:hypothetical protein